MVAIACAGAPDVCGAARVVVAGVAVACGYRLVEDGADRRTTAPASVGLPWCGSSWPRRGPCCAAALWSEGACVAVACVCDRKIAFNEMDVLSETLTSMLEPYEWRFSYVSETEIFFQNR